MVLQQTGAIGQGENDKQRITGKGLTSKRANCVVSENGTGKLEIKFMIS